MANRRLNETFIRQSETPTDERRSTKADTRECVGCGYVGPEEECPECGELMGDDVESVDQEVAAIDLPTESRLKSQRLSESRRDDMSGHGNTYFGKGISASHSEHLPKQATDGHEHKSVDKALRGRPKNNAEETPVMKGTEKGMTGESKLKNANLRIMKENAATLTAKIKRHIREGASNLNGKHTVNFTILVTEGKWKNRTKSRKRMAEAVADLEEVLQFHPSDDVVLEAWFINSSGKISGKHDVSVANIQPRGPIVSEGKAVFRFRRNAELFAQQLMEGGVTSRIGGHNWGTAVKAKVSMEQANNAFATISEAGGWLSSLFGGGKPSAREQMAQKAREEASQYWAGQDQAAAQQKAAMQQRAAHARAVKAHRTAAQSKVGGGTGAIQAPSTAKGDPFYDNLRAVNAGTTSTGSALTAPARPQGPSTRYQAGQSPVRKPMTDLSDLDTRLKSGLDKLKPFMDAIKQRASFTECKAILSRCLMELDIKSLSKPIDTSTVGYDPNLVARLAGQQQPSPSYAPGGQFDFPFPGEVGYAGQKGMQAKKALETQIAQIKQTIDTVDELIASFQAMAAKFNVKLESRRRYRNITEAVAEKFESSLLSIIDRLTRLAQEKLGWLDRNAAKIEQLADTASVSFARPRPAAKPSAPTMGRKRYSSRL